jgi:hypothetical protein
MRCFTRRGLLLFGLCAASILTHRAVADEPSGEPPKLDLNFFGNAFGLPYFAKDGVRKELKLTDAQISAIKELHDKLKVETDAFYKSRKVAEGQKSSDDDRKGVRLFYNEQIKRIDAKMREILSEAQFRRVEQLDLQLRPPISSLTTGPLPDILNLSGEQRDRLKGLKSEWLDDVPVPGGKEAGHASENSQSSLERIEKRMMEVLTDEQRRRLQKLKGPNADVLIAEIKTDISNRINSAVKKAEAKRAAAGSSTPAISETAPSHSK